MAVLLLPLLLLPLLLMVAPTVARPRPPALARQSRAGRRPPIHTTRFPSLVVEGGSHRAARSSRRRWARSRKWASTSASASK